MEEALFLVRFGEIGIKSPPVRRRFEALLADNILRGLRARAADGRVEQTWGRLFLRAPEGPAREALAHTFGIVSFSPAVEAPADLPALAAFAGKLAERIPSGARFAVRARRAGEVGFTSADVGREVGTAILQGHGARGLTVDLDEPDAEVIVEVRDGRAWVAFESLAGPGGLPVASEGHVSAWLASPADAVAAWLLQKRGCRVHLLGPAGADEGLARRLAAWDPPVEVTEVALEGPEAGDRALHLALLEAHGHRRRAAALVVGDRFEEALALAPLDRLVAPPVFRPLAGLPDPLVADLAARLGVPATGRGPPSKPAGPPDPAALRARAAELLKASTRRKVGP